MPMPDRTDHAGVLSTVRKALAHLSDPQYLEGLPYLDHLAVPVDGSLSRGQALCTALRMVIEAIAPNGEGEEGALDPFAHEILFRYAIGRQTMVSICMQLGISQRQAYRELRRAVDVVAWQLGRLSPDGAFKDDSEVRRLSGSTQVSDELERLVNSGEKMVDLVALLRDVAETIRGLAEERQVNIQLECDGAHAQVSANRIMLRQAFFNLSSHLIRHAKDRGDIRIHLHRSGTRAEVVLGPFPHTDGEGLDPKRPFAVAIDLLGLLGLDWSLSPVTENLDEIVISIPLLKRRTALIIDDNEDLVALFRRYLRQEPYETHGADSTSALAEFDRLQPDVIVLDVMMPDRDGWEILRMLRARQQAPPPKIIVCTIINDPGLASVLGADGFLNKPVSRDQLLGMVRSVLT